MRSGKWEQLFLSGEDVFSVIEMRGRVLSGFRKGLNFQAEWEGFFLVKKLSLGKHCVVNPFRGRATHF